MGLALVVLILLPPFLLLLILLLILVLSLVLLLNLLLFFGSLHQPSYIDAIGNRAPSERAIGNRARARGNPASVQR